METKPTENNFISVAVRVQRCIYVRWSYSCPRASPTETAAAGGWAAEAHPPASWLRPSRGWLGVAHSPATFLLAAAMSRNHVGGLSHGGAAENSTPELTGSRSLSRILLHAVGPHNQTHPKGWDERDDWGPGPNVNRDDDCPLADASNPSVVSLHQRSHAGDGEAWIDCRDSYKDWNPAITK